MNQLFGILVILVLAIELYRLLRGNWIRRILMKKKDGAGSRKPRVLKPKSEKDCPFCVKEKGQEKAADPKMPVPWSQRKGRGGPKKKLSTQGYFCSNPECEYCGIRDENIHALVGDGSHGKHEMIQDLKCQACAKKFTIRKNTVLYRLKTHSRTVEIILWLTALGLDVSALEEVFSVRETTIRTWLCRSGMHAKKLNERFMAGLHLLHVQLDELWANVKHSNQDMWVWVVTDATTKLVPVMQVGGRTQEMAYRVVHELKGRLPTGCVPVFSTDGLKNYFYALTAHFGKWEWLEGSKKPSWSLLSDFVYAQVIKHQRRRKTVEVERRILCGKEEDYRERLKSAGLSGRINTSFVERVNLTIRQCVSKLTRRTWGPAHDVSELVEHLEWWRSYYHFGRYHESLAVELATPSPRKGKQQPQRYRRRTPAMAAGLTHKKWTVKEILSYPLL
jgi:IS1 family transposase/transposase-like protein